MLLLTLPWFIAIMIRTEGAFLLASIGGDLAEKIAATGRAQRHSAGLLPAGRLGHVLALDAAAAAGVVTGWVMRKAARRARSCWAGSSPHGPCSRRSRPSSSTTPFRPTPRSCCWRRCRWCGWSTGSSNSGLGGACRRGGFAIGTLAFAVLAIGMPIAFGDGVDLLATAGRACRDRTRPILGVVAFYRGPGMVVGTAALAAAGIDLAWTLTAPACRARASSGSLRGWARRWPG
jgi:hypothetical protein